MRFNLKHIYCHDLKDQITRLLRDLLDVNIFGQVVISFEAKGSCDIKPAYQDTAVAFLSPKLRKGNN